MKSNILKGENMKLILSVLCITAILTVPALCQTHVGTWELSMAGNAGALTTSSEVTYGGQTSSDNGVSRNYFGLDLRPGYYVANGFSLEPEIYWLAAEKDAPTFNIGANAAYTFDIPQSSVLPYVTIGYGIGNGIPLMQRLVGRSSDELDIPVFRVGGGLKIFVASAVALKIEYRYERYSQETSGSFFGMSYTEKDVRSFHNILFGFSIFLPSGGQAENQAQ